MWGKETIRSGMDASCIQEKIGLECVEEKMAETRLRCFACGCKVLANTHSWDKVLSSRLRSIDWFWITTIFSQVALKIGKVALFTASSNTVMHGNGAKTCEITSICEDEITKMSNGGIWGSGRNCTK